MAGVIPKKPTSGRKQWSLHGSRSSLKRLRSQLASDGCPESQVVLAKQLLHEECEFKSEQKENARLGVYWLIKASEQGNVEATELLKTCLSTGKGINEQNYLDVKSCISMTQDEKVVRRAAREMFASLSNGSDYITSNQLQKKILAVDRGEAGYSKSSESKDFEAGDIINGDIVSENYDDIHTSDSDEEVDWSQKSDIANEKLTEENIVLAALSFSHGCLPVVNNILCLKPPNLNAVDHIPYVYRPILHPMLTLYIFYYKCIRFLGDTLIHCVLPLVKSEITLIGLFLLYAIFNSQESLLYFIPILLFYVTFLIMVISTFHMLQTSRDLHDYRLWAGLFICYSNGDLNNDQAFELQFLLNNTKPYLWYFCSVLLHYFCYAVIPTTNKMESEFTVIACCLTFMTLFGFMQKRRSKTMLDSLVLLSFALNVLARYPYDTDPIVSKGWRYLELNIPSFPSYIIGNGIEFCISFRLFLYALIPILLTRVAMKDKWYKVLLPHLVTLSWLQYFAFCSHNATTYGLYRATLALVGSVFFLPLVGITSVVLPVVALTKWLVTSNVFLTVCCFVFLIVLSLGIAYLCARTRYAKYTAVIQIVMMLVAFIVLLRSQQSNATNDINSLDDENDVKSSQFLDWNVFQNMCYNENENLAVAQLKCVELDGAAVYWDGYVNDVRLKNIRNSFKSVVDYFPKFISYYLYSIYGEKRLVNLHKPSAYTLDNYNQYLFEVTVKMQLGIWAKTSEISLNLGHNFKNFTLKLRADDHIWFKGYLENHLSAGVPQVKVDELGCVVCRDPDLDEVKPNHVETGNVIQFVDKICEGFRFVLNVMFNPVIVFK